MVDFSNYRIGRSDICEIQISGSTVSRIHAEITVSGNKYLLVDCDSSSGTFVQQNGQWKPIRQTYVDLNDIIRFGNYETSCIALISMIPSTKSTHGEESMQSKDVDSRPVGQVKRNPLTGEIVKN